MMPVAQVPFFAFFDGVIDKSNPQEHVAVLNKDGNFYILQLDDAGKLYYTPTDNITHWIDLEDAEQVVQELSEF